MLKHKDIEMLRCGLKIIREGYVEAQNLVGFYRLTPQQLVELAMESIDTREYGLKLHHKHLTENLDHAEELAGRWLGMSISSFSTKARLALLDETGKVA